MTALEERAVFCCIPTALPSPFAFLLWRLHYTSLPTLCLLKVPLITGQSPRHHALGKTDLGARRVVEKMWRGRDPGDVPAGHLSPVSKEHLVWSQLAFSEGNKCVFVKGTLAATIFMLSRRRETYSRIEKKWKWIYVFFSSQRNQKRFHSYIIWCCRFYASKNWEWIPGSKY